MRYWVFGVWCFFVFTTWISRGYVNVWEMTAFLMVYLIVFIYPAALLHCWRCDVANRTQTARSATEGDGRGLRAGLAPRNTQHQ